MYSSVLRPLGTHPRACADSPPVRGPVPGSVAPGPCVPSVPPGGVAQAPASSGEKGTWKPGSWGPSQTLRSASSLPSGRRPLGPPACPGLSLPPARTGRPAGSPSSWVLTASAQVGWGRWALPSGVHLGLSVPLRSVSGCCLRPFSCVLRVGCVRRFRDPNMATWEDPAPPLAPRALRSVPVVSSREVRAVTPRCLRGACVTLPASFARLLLKKRKERGREKHR